MWLKRLTNETGGTVLAACCRGEDIANQVLGTDARAFARLARALL